MVIRPRRQVTECCDAIHAWRSRPSLDSTDAGGTRRHVPNYFCVEIQRDGGLTGHRVPLALAYAAGGDKLRNSDASVAAIALELGYESESASSKAFRREMGRSPRQFSRGHNNRLPTRAGGETPTRKMELVAG
jgi:methylphosphotriester-DNA--protein-cysteine methyltransferase